MKENGSGKKGSRRPDRENKSSKLIQKRNNKLDTKHKSSAVGGIS